jgi:DNA-binding NtrC family response regulator
MARASTTEQTVDEFTTGPSAGGGAMSVVMLTVLYHRDLSRVGERAVLAELVGSGEAWLSRVTPSFGHPSGTPLRPLDDVHVSRTPLRLVAAPDGGVRLDPSGSRTKITVAGESVRQPITWPAEALRAGVVLRLGKDVVLLLHRAEISDVPSREDLGLVGDNPAIHRTRREIRRVADHEMPVLVRGETGTGKELVARALHEASVRRGAPFLAINLAAVPSALAAAELFGAERGAFTGAVQERAGYFAMARGGTLFLDEIGDAPLDVQAMLLRAIETGEVQGVGAGKPQRVSVRLVAATDADLEERVRDGRFRAPLLHRLTTHEIRLPPLRERRDDIARLLLHFLREELAAARSLHLLDAPPGDEHPWLPASLVARLVEAPWEGNVRQLRNVARQIVVQSRDLPRAALSPVIERVLAPERTPERASTPAPPSPAATPPRRKPAEITDAELVEALRRNRWEPAAAAAELGMTRPSLYLRIRKSGLVRTAGDLSPEEITRSYQEHGGDVARVADALEVSESALRRRIRELGITKS